MIVYRLVTYGSVEGWSISWYATKREADAARAAHLRAAAQRVVPGEEEYGGAIPDLAAEAKVERLVVPTRGRSALVAWLRRYTPDMDNG